ncbi:ABC transporter ATP-binding protein [Alphaproteobacteria bacterium]|nr:ABC transporter ATP-binding protein [Alphaproteobacteria bacterium]
MNNILEVNNLSKKFGPLQAVDDISLSLKRGEVLGFLGPNGAGKSTTMKMITGFINPSAGSIRVSGNDISKFPIKTKQSIGYLPEGAPLYGDMNPRSLLYFTARIRGLNKKEIKRRIDELIALIHLEEVYFRPIDSLSKGFKRRVGLAQALIHNPDLLILDEPTDGLDPNQKFEVRELLKKMSSDKAIVISTHILEEVDAVCSRAVIINKGKILIDGTPQELKNTPIKESFYQVTINKELLGELKNIIQSDKRLNLLDSAVLDTDKFNLRLSTESSFSIDQLNEVFINAKIKLVELKLLQNNLDDVFRNITK